VPTNAGLDVLINEGRIYIIGKIAGRRGRGFERAFGSPRTPDIIRLYAHRLIGQGTL